MSKETLPEKEKKSDSTDDKSDKATEHLDNVDRLTTALNSFVTQLAKLIVTKNWVSLLLLVEAVVILFCFPGGILAQLIKTTFGTELPEQYPVFFWLTVAGIFLTALIIAVRTIQRKPSPLPDFTERKAIKGLRAFTKEDAEIFARLERELDLRECLESITSKTFRIGILMGESGVGKSSFLQAGIIPQLAKSESSHRGVYIRFSNQEPIVTIHRALAEELQLSATETTETNNRDLLGIFSLAVATADKPLILIFDQFEQFFVHFKQKVDREPFVNALKDWYCADNPLPIKILISIRGDLADRLIELQKALGYSLSPYEVFRLEKFAPESATKILQVIAQASEIPFDEKYMLELTSEELASREDSLISPVDLQVLAKTIERQKNELQAFNRPAFQKIGGIEGLMTRFLKTTLDARVIPRQREAAIKVLLAMTDLDRNVRAGALTIEEIQEKTQGTLTPGEIVEAITWLASGEVRLITSVEQDGNYSYELAHERLIPALREEARRELTSADRANQLLDRRVNEWLGNQRSNRYLFNWQELRLFEQQKPYLVWGANKTHKENLLQRSWKKLTRQLIAMAMVLVLGLVGMGWWYSPWGQIQQVRWELAGLSKRVSNSYRSKAALAFLKDDRLKQALAITDSIKDSYYKAWVLSEIADIYIKLEKLPQAGEYLDKIIVAAVRIDGSDDSYKRAEVLTEIAETIGKLEKLPQAGEYLDKTIVAAGQIDDSYKRAEILTAIAETIGKLENLPQAEEYLDRVFSAAEQIDNSSHIAWVLATIAITYHKLEKLPQAEEYLDKTIVAAEQIDNSSYIAWVLAEIANSYHKLKKLPQAEEYLDKTIVAAEQIDNSYDRARVLTEIANTYHKLKKLPQAEVFLGKAFSAVEQIDEFKSRVWVLKEIAQSYDKLENLTQAGVSLDQAIAATAQIDNSYSRAWELKEIAQSYGKLENLPQARVSLDQAIAATAQIDDSFNRADVLTGIAKTIGKLEKLPQATVYLDKVFSASEQIDNSSDRAMVLEAIAENYGKLENFPQAAEYLNKALTAAEQIDNSYYRASVLTTITQTQAKLSHWRQAHHNVSKCPTDECKVESLAHILTTWAEKKNPALVDKPEE